MDTYLQNILVHVSIWIQIATCSSVLVVVQDNRG